MALIDFFRCLEDFGVFWSSGAIINWADIVVVLLSWKISSDMSNISDSDREQWWNASWNESLKCWSSNFCLYAFDFVMIDRIYL